MFKNIAETARTIERTRIRTITALNADLLRATSIYQSCTNMQIAPELQANCTRIAKELAIAEQFHFAPLGNLQKIVAHGPVHL